MCVGPSTSRKCQKEKGPAFSLWTTIWTRPRLIHREVTLGCILLTRRFNLSLSEAGCWTQASVTSRSPSQG